MHNKKTVRPKLAHYVLDIIGQVDFILALSRVFLRRNDIIGSDDSRKESFRVLFVALCITKTIWCAAHQMQKIPGSVDSLNLAITPCAWPLILSVPSIASKISILVNRNSRTQGYEIFRR